MICDQISDGRVLQLIRGFLEAGVIADGGWEPTKTGVPQGGVASPLWSNIFLTPFDHAMTAAGYRVTRWADDFVVVCRTRQEAQTARALAGSFLRNELGVSLHPEKTRIVHVDHGFEFLGYKVKRGKGLRLSASKRTSPCQSAQPLRRAARKVGGQVQGSNPQPDAATSAGEAAGHDRGDKPDHPRLGELLPESECPKAVPSAGWVDRASAVVLHQ